MKRLGYFLSRLLDMPLRIALLEVGNSVLIAAAGFTVWCAGV